MVLELRQKNSLTIKACLGSEVTGFVTAKIIHPEVQIVNIAVDTKHLRKNIATMLIKTLIEKTKKMDCTKITLEVNYQNKPALTLYYKLGFKFVGERPKFYNNKDTAVLMDLDY
jgi:ribosomal-protein-alanine N-acetyltransferase